MAGITVENITVDHMNIASILMGYNINTGWRSQPNITISIPYKAWLTFTQTYRHLRPLVQGLTINDYYTELATVQFNEVLRCYQDNREATLILPLNDNSDVMNFSEYNESFEKLGLIDSGYLVILQDRVERYYKLNDKDIFVPTSVNIKKMSAWNKKLLIQAISYLLLGDKLYSIERR